MKKASDQPEVQIPSMVSNMAAIDKFTAPDSTASRPDPESKTDRPRKPNQTPDSAVSADLPG